MSELVPRHAGRGNESLRRLRTWLGAYDIELVSLEIGWRQTELVWVATVIRDNHVTSHTVEVGVGNGAHTKAVLRRVGRSVVEARSQ